MASAAAMVTPALKASRIAKNCTAVSSAMMLGDALCQGMETFDSGSKFSWDHARTMRMGVTGAFLVTPASFSWNLYAERLAPGTSLRAILTKLGVSIAVLPPMLAAQFAALTLLEKDKNLDDVHRKLSRDYMPTLKNALLFWPMVSVVNSAFVPVLTRPIFSSFVGVFWNVYISYQANHNGMEVGEVSGMYSQERGEEEEGAGAEGELAGALLLAKKAAAETTAEKLAVAAAALEDKTLRAGVVVNSVEASTAAAAAVMEGEKQGAAAKVEGGVAAAGTPAQTGRKKRGRLVRRTSVVSM